MTGNAGDARRGTTGRADAERAVTAEHRVVGTSARRVDGIAKVTGAARYTVDLSVPGMAHAIVVRSTRAHARIASIDRAAAATSPGVIRVLTGDDLLAAGLTPYYGHVVLDHPVLAIERVRFHGEPVAVVVAETRREAYPHRPQVVVPQQLGERDRQTHLPEGDQVTQGQSLVEMEAVS